MRIILRFSANTSKRLKYTIQYEENDKSSNALWNIDNIKNDITSQAFREKYIWSPLRTHFCHFLQVFIKRSKVFSQSRGKSHYTAGFYIHSFYLPICRKLLMWLVLRLSVNFSTQTCTLCSTDLDDTKCNRHHPNFSLSHTLFSPII